MILFSLLLLGGGCASDVQEQKIISSYGYSIRVQEDWYAEFDTPNQDRLHIQNFPYPPTDIVEFSEDAFWLEISFNTDKTLSEFRSDFAFCSDVTLDGLPALRCTGRRDTTPETWQQVGYYVDNLKPTLILLSAQQDPGPGIDLAESTVQTIRWEPQLSGSAY